MAKSSQEGAQKSEWDRRAEQIDDEMKEMVHVWPHLLSIEMIAAVVFLLTLTLMAVFVNAPLEVLADLQNTPNPSKAPWYFMSLQELLLHMHPALAGVLVPGVVLGFLAVIPFIDNKSEGVGWWFTTENGLQIAKFAAVYTVIVDVFLVLFDEFIGVTELVTGFGLPVWTGEIALPMVIMVGTYLFLAWICRRVWAATTRELIIAFFVVFFVSYFTLTIIGTAFRGPGMHLYWPWAMPPGTH